MIFWIQLDTELLLVLIQLAIRIRLSLRVRNSSVDDCTSSVDMNSFSLSFSFIASAETRVTKFDYNEIDWLKCDITRMGYSYKKLLKKDVNNTSHT